MYVHTCKEIFIKYNVSTCLPKTRCNSTTYIYPRYQSLLLKSLQGISKSSSHSYFIYYIYYVMVHFTMLQFTYYFIVNLIYFALKHHNYITFIFRSREVWRYQTGNQNPYIEEELTTQWPTCRLLLTDGFWSGFGNYWRYLTPDYIFHSLSIFS